MSWRRAVSKRCLSGTAGKAVRWVGGGRGRCGAAVRGAAWCATDDAAWCGAARRGAARCGTSRGEVLARGITAGRLTQGEVR